MPTLPAALADRAERWFGRPATVTDVKAVSPSLVRVTFAGDLMRGRHWHPGNEVEFRVSDHHLRHYTPARFDTATGTFDVMFCTVAGGPGTGWALGLRPGSPVTVIGPSPSVRWRGGLRPLLLGDATTLGLLTALAGATLEPGPFGAVEVPAEDVPAVARLMPHLDVLAACAEPGAALCAWVAERSLVGTDRAYVAGHAGTVQRLRNLLRETGLPRGSITGKAYWATGRAGL